MTGSERGFTGIIATRVQSRATSTVRFRPAKLVRLSGESAVISGLSSVDPIVSLTPHLLQERTRVRTASESKENQELNLSAITVGDLQCYTATSSRNEIRKTFDHVNNHRWDEAVKGSRAACPSPRFRRPRAWW